MDSLPSAAPNAPPRYLFAYGSLIQRAARVKTVASVEVIYPVIATGIRRGWFFQYEPSFGPTLSPTYLGAVADPGSTCNGVLFALPSKDLDALNWKEQGYLATRLDPARVEVMEGELSLSDAEVWYYASPEIRAPNMAHPIVQSYVDVCIGGCLEIEETFPAARQRSFAREFIASTDGWQEPWINDRLLPWRPSVHEPRAWDIDELLHEVLGADLFAQIKLPGL